MPSRDRELGPLIRNVFLPEEGEVWCKPDISQQEFRFVVHHAVLRNLQGAKEAAEHYRSDPNADYHAIVAEMTGLDRDLAKAVNFAKIYGAGIAKFAEMIGKPQSEARAIIAQYDSRLPFVARLSRVCQDEAVERGYTVLYNRASEHPSGYVIEEKRLCWSGCDPAGYFGFWRARSVMDWAADVVRAVAREDPGTVGQRMGGFDLAGLGRQPERLGRDLQELGGVAEVEPGLDPVLRRP